MNITKMRGSGSGTGRAAPFSRGFHQLVASAAGALALALPSLAFAGTVGVTSLAALGSDDSIDWGQLFKGSPVTPGGSVTSLKGRSATVSSTFPIFGLFKEGSGFGYGGFTDGEWIIATEFSYEINITFASPVSGVGVQIDPVSSGPFVGEIIGYNGAVLGSFSEAGIANDSGIGDGSNIFIGLKSSSADITSIRFDIPTPPPGAPVGRTNFAIGTLYIAGVAVPEPSTWALMLVGMGALGGMARRGRKDAGRREEARAS